MTGRVVENDRATSVPAGDVLDRGRTQFPDGSRGESGLTCGGEQRFLIEVASAVVLVHLTEYSVIF